MRFLYTFSIYLYYSGAWILSYFNPKARKWIQGQKNIFENIKGKFSENDKTVWFHAASLGEFEQGRPVIEEFINQHSDFKVLITFFSPSGFEVRKDYDKARFITYLPIDTLCNAVKFIKWVQPDMVFFIKYEFWFNYLYILKKNNIPTYLISGIFRNNQHFFKTYGFWFKKHLNCFSHFFVQDENSLHLLRNIGFQNVTVSGDTRFDRVYKVSQSPVKISLIEKFIKSSKVIIICSCFTISSLLFLTKYFPSILK